MKKKRNLIVDNLRQILCNFSNYNVRITSRNAKWQWQKICFFSLSLSHSTIFFPLFFFTSQFLEIIFVESFWTTSTCAHLFSNSSTFLKEGIPWQQSDTWPIQLVV